MRTIRVYRHGEATGKERVLINGVWEDVAGGQLLDAELTAPLGWGHAINIGRRIQSLERIGLICPKLVQLAASTAFRGCESLSIAAAWAGIDAVPDYYPDLTELDQGLWVGHPKRYPLVLPDGMALRFVPVPERDFDYALGGTETLRAVQQRTMRALGEIAAGLPEDGTAVVVAHRTPITLAAVAITGDMDLMSADMGFGAETCIAIDGSGQWHLQHIGLSTSEL